MDMASILAIIQLAALLLPLIQQAVVWVEDMVNQAKANGTISTITGADKLAAALTFVQNLWPQIAATGTGAKIATLITPEQFTATATSLINSVVGIFNTLGIFKKSTPAAPSA
jgi:hypothetical protein